MILRIHPFSESLQNCLNDTELGICFQQRDSPLMTPGGYSIGQIMLRQGKEKNTDYSRWKGSDPL